MDAVGIAGELRVLGADLEHVVAKAVPGAQQQHRFLLQFIGRDALAPCQRVLLRHRHHERLVVQRRSRQACIGEGLGEDGGVELTGAQHVQQLGGEVFLQHQRHARHALDGLAHQIWQQVGPDRVDHAQAQRPRDRVLAAAGDLLDAGRLFDHCLRLPHDFLAQRRDADLVAAALEQLDVELFFQLLDRHAQRRLRDEAGFSGAAEMAFASHRDDVSEFGQGHGVIFAPGQAFR